MKKQIQALITEARKARDSVKLTAFQAVLSNIQAREATENKELPNTDIVSIIKKEIKACEETAEMYEGKNEAEYSAYIKKIQHLKDTLPTQIDESKYEYLIDDAIAEVKATSIRDMGKVIGKLKAEHPNSLDFGKVSAMVKDRLLSI